MAVGLVAMKQREPGIETAADQRDPAGRGAAFEPQIVRPPLRPSRFAIEAGAMLPGWLCDPCGYAGAARNAAKPAKQTRPAFANVVQRGRGAGLLRCRANYNASGTSHILRKCHRRRAAARVSVEQHFLLPIARTIPV